MSTIADVARVAGVSISTVSYALSGKRPVAPDTAKRVQDAIDQLGYRPHAGARALASNRTHVLGLVAPLRPEVGLPVIMAENTTRRCGGAPDSAGAAERPNSYSRRRRGGSARSSGSFQSRRRSASISGSCCASSGRTKG